MNRSWTGEKRCWPLQVQCLREGAWQGSEKGTGTAVLRFVMWTRLTSSYFILTSLTSSSCILYSCFVNFIHLSAHRMSFCFTPPRRAPPSTAVAPATTTNAKLVPWHRDQRQHHRHHRSAFSALMGKRWKECDLNMTKKSNIRLRAACFMLFEQLKFLPLWFFGAIFSSSDCARFLKSNRTSLPHP